jgi:anaerobic ribonucleoside-triphosphate reductase activating protein
MEGVEAAGLRAVVGDLLPPPRPVNCARPLPGGVSPRPLTPAATMAAATSMLLRVARIYHGSVVDGPGRRSVVQVQGCPLRCPGCYVLDTHDPAGGVLLTVPNVLAAVLDPAGAPRDGVTVLGGEPFAQPVGLAALLRGLKAQRIHTTVYSGYTVDALRARQEHGIRQALTLTDLLIDGPFVAAVSDGAGEWRGSRNQRLIPRPG